LRRAIKAWGHGSPDVSEKPHNCTAARRTCTVGRKFWFSDSGVSTATGISSREKRRAEERLRACGALGPDEEISGAVEAVSFDDTVEELRRVVEDGLDEDRTIPVGSEQTYEVIADFVRGLCCEHGR
jgi:hypothetical protein